MLINKKLLIVVLAPFAISIAHAMTVSGPITVNTVTVTGSVTMSSMTVSSATVQGMNVLGSYDGVPGRVLQVHVTSTTIAVTTVGSSSTVTALTQSFQLTNSNNYVRISLSGNLYCDLAAADPTSIAQCFVTIYRDDVNLGLVEPLTDFDDGLAVVESVYNQSSDVIFTPSSPVGIKLVDFPGDTSPHIYTVSVYPNTDFIVAKFPNLSVGYLLLEEVSQP